VSGRKSGESSGPEPDAAVAAAGGRGGPCAVPLPSCSGRAGAVAGRKVRGGRASPRATRMGGGRRCAAFEYGPTAGTGSGGERGGPGGRTGDRLHARQPLTRAPPRR